MTWTRQRWCYHGTRWNEHASAQLPAVFPESDWRDVAGAELRKIFDQMLSEAGLDPSQYTIVYDTTPLAAQPAVLNCPIPAALFGHCSGGTCSTLWPRNSGSYRRCGPLDAGTDENGWKAVSYPDFMGDHQKEARQDRWRRLHGGDP